MYSQNDLIVLKVIKNLLDRGISVSNTGKLARNITRDLKSDRAMLSGKLFLIMDEKKTELRAELSNVDDCFNTDLLILMDVSKIQSQIQGALRQSATS